MTDEDLMFGDLFATVRVQDLPASREVVAVERQENGTWRVCGSAIANTDGIAELGIEGSKASRVYAFAIDHWGEPFTPNRSVAYGDIIRPSVFLGWLYRVTAPGALPDEEPVWWNSTPGMPRPVGTAMAQAEMYFQPIAHGPVDIEWEDKEEGDPHWDKVVALLHFDGDLVDEKGSEWVQAGSTQISSAAAVFGDYGLEGRGFVGNHVTVSDPAPLRIDAGEDFTIECFVQIRSGTNTGRFLNTYTGTTGPNLILERIIGTGKFTVFDNTQIVRDSGLTMLLDTTYHVALVRVQGVFIPFLGGVKGAEWTNNGALLFSTFRLLYNTYSNQSPLAYLDELRITKGVARYTENFTPPTEPFPNFK